MDEISIWNKSIEDSLGIASNISRNRHRQIEKPMQRLKSGRDLIEWGYGLTPGLKRLGKLGIRNSSLNGQCNGKNTPDTAQPKVKFVSTLPQFVVDVTLPKIDAHKHAPAQP